MNRLVDIRAEKEVLGKLEDKGKLLRKELVASFFRSMTVPLLVCGYLLFSLFNMLIDVYLMAQSSYGPRLLKIRMQSYIDAFRSFFLFLKPLPLFRLIPPLRLGIGFLDLFTLEVNVGEGVSCLGQQAPMYLLLNYFIISIVVVLIDSSIFLFLRLSPENFALPVARVLPQCGVPRKAALFLEETFIQGVFFVVGRNMKTILQLVMAKMLWIDFLPRWDDYTQRARTNIRDLRA